MTGETSPAAGQDLLAVCEVCLQLIADGDGAVWCRPETAAAPSEPSDCDDDTSLTLTELLAQPDTRARWRVTHEDCEPAAGYQIAVERIRTWPAYLHWTARDLGHRHVGD